MGRGYAPVRGGSQRRRGKKYRRSDRRAGFSRPIGSGRLCRSITRKFTGSSFPSAPVAGSSRNAGRISGCRVGFVGDPAADPGEHRLAVALAGLAPRESIGAGSMCRRRKPVRRIPDMEAGKERRRSGARSVRTEAISGAHEALGARARHAGGLCFSDPASADSVISVSAGGGRAEDPGSSLPGGVRRGTSPPLRPDRVAWGDVRPPHDPPVVCDARPVVSSVGVDVRSPDGWRNSLRNLEA